MRCMFILDRRFAMVCALHIKELDSEERGRENVDLDVCFPPARHDGVIESEHACVQENRIGCALQSVQQSQAIRDEMRKDDHTNYPISLQIFDKRFHPIQSIHIQCSHFNYILDASPSLDVLLSYRAFGYGPRGNYDSRST